MLNTQGWRDFLFIREAKRNKRELSAMVDNSV